MVRRFDTIYIICKILKFAKNTFLKEQNVVRENKEMTSLTNYLLTKNRLHLIN